MPFPQLSTLVQNDNIHISLGSEIAMIFACMLFFTVPPAFSQEKTKELDNEISEKKYSFADHINFSLTARTVKYDPIDEIFTYSPMERIFENTDKSWLISWDENILMGTLTYDILYNNFFYFSSGINFGISQAEFLATNQKNEMYEWWRTKVAFLWGVHLETEVFLEQKSGPFLRMSYDWYTSSAGEDKEVIRQPDGTFFDNSDYKVATFSWETHELQALVGWRFSFLNPLVGVSYSRFTLRKHLVNTLVDPRLDPQVLEAINSDPARFKYQNNNEFSMIIALMLSIHENIELTGLTHINNDQYFQLMLKTSF